MKWKASYSTGIKKIDDEHRMLVEMLGKLERSMTLLNSDQMLALALKNLVDYVKFHFKSEEDVMKKIGFPELQRHRKLHKNLVDEVAAILLDLKQGRTLSLPELVAFLQHWLVDHIIGEDLKIGKYLGVV